MSQELVVRNMRNSLPAVLLGIGVLDLVFVHSILVAVLLFAGSAILFVTRKLGAKLSAIEGASVGVPASESPEEQFRKTLKRRLMKLQGVDGCESLASIASDHFLQADERFRSFDRLLRIKLSPTELTFSRYHSASEQVFLAILDRLSDAADLLSSVEAVHPSDVKEKLRNLAAQEKIPGNAEFQSYQDRLQLVQTQQSKVNAILKMNEEALTEMDRANVALTEMKTQNGLSSAELNEALKQLEELAQRAKTYSN